MPLTSMKEEPLAHSTYFQQRGINCPIQFQVYAGCEHSIVNSEWTFFVVPFEAVRSLSFEKSSSISPDILWAPTLERRLRLPPSPFTNVLVLELSLIPVKPGIHTLYVGGCRHDNNALKWHHHTIQLHTE